jgi:CHAD domain-containing protein
MAITTERSKFVFRKTERELVRLASDRRPDAVHGFRTTTRRLQVLFEQLVPAKSDNEKKLLKMLNRIRRRAGKIRDVDVQLAALRSFKVPLEPRRKSQLVQRLIELRGRHEDRLRKLLKKRDVREIHKRLKKASAKAAKTEISRDPLQVAKQVLGSVNLSKWPIDNEKLHDLRLAVKRARYSAEFAPKSDGATELVTELKRLQDVLGAWHDWQTLTETATQQLGEVGQSSLVAALSNVTRGKFRHAVEAIAGSSVQPDGKISPAMRVVREPVAKAPAPVKQAETAA